jgi:hypothetical protein
MIVQISSTIHSIFSAVALGARLRVLKHLWVTRKRAEADVLHELSRPNLIPSDNQLILFHKRRHGLTFRVRASTALTNCTISLGSKPRYDNSTRPSSTISDGCLSLVSLTIASHVGFSDGSEVSLYSDGALFRGLGRDEGDMAVKSLEEAEGRFVPLRSACSPGIWVP